MNEADARSARAFRALEALLVHLHPREDASAQIAELKAHFASADALFGADAHALERLGVRAGDALLLSRLTELNRCMMRARFDRRPQLGRLREASAYLSANFYGLRVERFYMFCLDARGRLKARVLLQEGTSDGALFSLKAMLTEVVRVQPDAVILSHNHPGRTLRPSQDDLSCTLSAIRALTVVGVPMLDHVIVAGSQAVSLRDNGFLPAGLWLSQAPEHRLNRRWLDAPPPADAPGSGTD